MNFKEIIIILSLSFIFSCSEDIHILSDECVECIEHQYEQANNNNSILLTLESGQYCIGDSAWLTPNGMDYWYQIDQELLNFMESSGFCNFLELEEPDN